MSDSTRREALATIAVAGAAAPVALEGAHHEYAPETLSAEQYELLSVLVDVIIPETDTPGASQAGVAQMVDEDAADDAVLKGEVEKMLARFSRDGFLGLSETGRNLLMTDYAVAQDDRGETFTFLKNLTVDRYYATEAGLAQELGYKGNTFLPSFPGCQHEHELDDPRGGKA